MPSLTKRMPRHKDGAWCATILGGLVTLVTLRFAAIGLHPDQEPAEGTLNLIPLPAPVKP